MPLPLVFCDTLAWTRRWELARQALRPANLFLLATAGAAVDFAHTRLTHPPRSFRPRGTDSRVIIARRSRPSPQSGVRSHVLWAERDTLLHREDGRKFAAELGATFETISPRPGSKTVDHNWM